MIGLVDAPLDARNLLENLRCTQGCGAVLVHFGVVKPVVEGRQTQGLRFVRVGNPEVELQELEDVLKVKWHVEDVVLLRRIGDVGVGEVISMVAVAAPHRQDALGALGDAIEGLCAIEGLAKEELFAE